MLADSGPYGFDLTSGVWFAPFAEMGAFDSVAGSHLADELRAAPFIIGFDVNVDAFGFEVVSAGAGNIRLGLWDSDGSNYQPASLIQDGGAIDCSTTGFKTASFTAIQLQRNHLYWFGYNSDTGFGTWTARTLGNGAQQRQIRWGATTNLQNEGRQVARDTAVTYGALPDFAFTEYPTNVDIIFQLMRVA
jgi:hypothetical protein